MIASIRSRSRGNAITVVAWSMAAAILAAPAVSAQETTTDAGSGDVGLLPMGRLVWTSDRARDGGLSVWMLEAGAAAPRQLTFGEVNDFTAEISPDGAAIVFSSDRDNPGALTASGSYLRAYDIYRLDLGSDEPERLYGDRSYKMDPTWSPDGSTIVYEGEDRDAEQIEETGGLVPQLWLLPADGSGSPRMLTDEPGGAADPAWSPDGSHILYRTIADGRIMVLDTDGSDPAPLTEGPGDAEPAWSPDGSLIAFSSDRGGDREIYVMDADGGGLRQLTESPGFDGQPTWSPDGSLIAFATDRGPSRDIYLMAADGSGLQGLSGNGPGADGEHRGSDFSPSWSW